MIGALRWLVLAAVIVVIVRSQSTDVPLRTQAAADATTAWRWIANAKMMWPLSIAVLSNLVRCPGAYAICWCTVRHSWPVDREAACE